MLLFHENVNKYYDILYNYQDEVFPDEASQRAWAVKHLYQVVSTTSRKVLGMLEPSALTERTHQVIIQAKDGTWRCRRSQKALKLIGTAEGLSRAFDMVGNFPRPRRNSAKAILEWPKPKHVKGARSFLGLANFY